MEYSCDFTPHNQTHKLYHFQKAAHGTLLSHLHPVRSCFSVTGAPRSSAGFSISICFCKAYPENYLVKLDEEVTVAFKCSVNGMRYSFIHISMYKILVLERSLGAGSQVRKNSNTMGKPDS